MNRVDHFCEIDDITANVVNEDGILVTREISKRVLMSNGAYVGIAFLVQYYDLEKERYRSPGLELKKYKKRGLFYILDSHFCVTRFVNIGNLVKVLLDWGRTWDKIVSEGLVDPVMVSDSERDYGKHYCSAKRSEWFSDLIKESVDEDAL